MNKMKKTLLSVAGVIAVAVFALGIFLTWPYRGFLPLLKPVPTDPGSAIPATGQPAGSGEGKNETGLPLALPSGFSIKLFARDLGNPRVLIEAPYSTLLVSAPEDGKVFALSDEDGDGVAETKTVLQGLNRPHGLALDPGVSGKGFRLYVAESDALSVYEYDAAARTASGRKKLLTLPDDGRHWTKTLQWFGTDLLIAMGSSCDTCHEDDVRRATVQRYSAASGSLSTFAKGLRNSVFMTLKDGKVWATEMGRDFLGDDLPPDEVNILEEGKNYGWPTCYGKNIHDTVFDKNTYIRNPCMDPFETPSLIDLPAHSAPLGLAFVPKGTGWPKEYEGNLLVAYHGSWNRTVPTGYAIRRFVLNAQNIVVRDEDFVSGWLTDKGVLGRPVGLQFGDDGALYVTDDRAGNVYRIVPPTR